MPAQSPMQLGLFAPQTTQRQLRLTEAAASSSSLGVCVLGSGSGGNSTVVTHAGRAMLIDAGFGPRTTAQRLQKAGVELTDIEAICLTHLDQDHFRPHWTRTLLKHRIRLFVHHKHAAELLAIESAGDLLRCGLLQTFDDALEPLPGLRGVPIDLQHDSAGVVGYRFDSAGGCALGYATDLGHVPGALLEHFRGVSVLCLESNHDAQMTLASGRPAWLNRRNMSDGGHLSNEQAYAAVCEICQQSQPGLPRYVVLMHRSRQCNDPRKVREVFEQNPDLWRRVTLTQQHCATRWFSVQSMQQSNIGS